LACVFSATVYAQAPAAAKQSQSEMKRQFTERSERASAPTEPHKALAAFVGDFDLLTEVRIGPGEPMKARSTAKGRSTMGGRFVEVRSESTPEEELKGERLLIYGYDPGARKYTLANFDSGSLTATMAVGDYDAATKTFTFDGERGVPGGGKVPFRWVLKLEAGGAIDQKILVKAGEQGFTEVVAVKHTPKAK
jgi:hypothetical protein